MSRVTSRKKRTTQTDLLLLGGLSVFMALSDVDGSFSASLSLWSVLGILESLKTITQTAVVSFTRHSH